MDSIVYDKIEKVILIAGKPLAEFEFDDVSITANHDPRVVGDPVNGRLYVGCSQSTLARRMREMRALGRLTSNRREGKQFMEYDIAFTPAENVNAKPQEPVCPV